MTNTVVIGLGAPLMRDEGAGVHLVRALAARSDEFPGVDFIDLGTASARVLHAIANRQKVVILDCTFMDEAPGTIRRFTPDEVRSVKGDPRMSLHGGDLFQTLELSAALGEQPDSIVMFGIQPDDVAQGEELSPVLAARFDEYMALIAAEISEVADA